MNRWRYIEDGMRDGAYNMAVDTALLRTCEEDATFAPTLRLYGWRAPTLSIGYSQPVEREIDLKRCREAGIEWVRRPTGGRALLHRQELTYSLVGPVAHPLFQGGLKATYAAVSRALLSGLEELGISGACINPGGKPSASARAARSPACFASLNHCEITVHGRKLIGSAQRRTQRAFLQHGSILIDTDHDLFHSLLVHAGGAAGEAALDRLKAATITLNEIMQPPPAFEPVRDGFYRGMTAYFGGDWQKGGLTGAERALCESILERHRTTAGTAL